MKVSRTKLPKVKYHSSTWDIQQHREIIAESRSLIKQGKTQSLSELLEDK